jgi:type IV pilus assembly protein PilN
MIRINLLAQGQPRAQAAPRFTLEQAVTALGVILLVGTGIALAWWSTTLGAEAARLDEELAAAERETARLQTLIQQVDEFERQRQQLQQRVSLIEELRRDQALPVHLLDEVSRALPEMLWLTQMKQEAAGEVTLEGRCIALTALSDFVGNLARSGAFARPVDIVNSHVAPPTAGGTDLITFTIKARLARAGGAAAPPAS